MTELLRRIARALERPARTAIARRMGGFRQPFTVPREEQPARAARPRKVAVIGGGLAGIAAAEALALRGHDVQILERGPHLGGKIGGELVHAAGATRDVDHGFHAYFRHYFNLNEFLARAGARDLLVPIEDYAILGADGLRWSFGDVATTPGVNLLDLAGKGLYRFRDVAPSTTRQHLDAFLEYDRAATFAALDDVSFAAWADGARLPPRLRRVLAIFSRAFFAEEHRLSTAEVIKAFHFYYLAHDHGLLYDYPAAPASALVARIERHLAQVGVRAVCGRTVETIAPVDGGFAVDDKAFDDVVIAIPAMAARAVALRSPAMAARCPETTRRLAALESSARYAVLRLWCDRDVRPGLPAFVALERARVLDAVAFVHRVCPEDTAWAASSGGAVLELHSYALPGDLGRDAAVRAAMLADLSRFFPELAGMTIVDEVLRVRDDFTALHVGMAGARPATATEHEGLVLAGDWVALPVPAMLMEGAFTSGLLAANALLRRDGLREVAVDTVPLRGLLADRAARRRVHHITAR